MFAMNLVTGPSFVGGLLVGLNKRNKPEFKHDPWAPTKLLSLTSGFGLAKVLADVEHPLPIQQRFLPALLGIPLVTGATFCMGLMLTKISEKDSF